jgi:signal transduction histidine kinase
MDKRLPVGRLGRVALSGLLFAIGVAWLSIDDGVPLRGPYSLGVLLVAGQSLPLVVSRRAPIATFAVIVLAATVYGSLSYPGSPIEIGELAALFLVSSGGPVSHAVLSAAACMTSIVIVATTSPEWGGGLLGVIAVCLVFSLVAVAGVHQRLRQVRLAEANERVFQIEQARAERDALAAMEERLRLARELHDMVGHTLAVVLLHAGLARRALDVDPQQVRRALAVIEDRGSAAMEEMQGLLGLLVEEAGGEDGLPTIDDLHCLGREVQGAGLEVFMSVCKPEDVVLPVAVELAAYRIVQEALTNTVRHAGARRAWVTVGVSGDRLEVTVADDGRGWVNSTTERRKGRGLVGMRERSVRLGGDLVVGTRPQGGVEIRACLPLDMVDARPLVVRR